MEHQPEEIIREFILQSVPDNLILPAADGKKDPRLQITQICSTWRRIAFTIPSLWAINIIISSDALINLANVWLRQSSGPVTLSISRLPRDPHFNSILKDLIIPNISRLETLGPLKLHIPQWNQISSLQFDVLTKLHLIVYYVDPTSPPDALVHAPALQEVLLEHITTSSRPSFVPELPWAQITTLSFHGGLTAPPDLFALLSKCTPLERCEIDTILSPPLSPNLALRLQYLKSLRLIISPVSSSSSDLLSSIISPQLSRLEMNLLPNSEIPLYAFTEHIRGIANTLRHFELLQEPNECRIFEERIISAMPLLTHLILCPGYFFSPAMLGNICRGDLLPDLQRLDFSVGDDVEEVLNMLKERPSQSSRLTRAIIYNYGNDLGDEMRGQLDVLRLDIEVIGRAALMTLNMNMYNEILAM